MKHLYLFILAALLITSCEINQKDIKPNHEFVKIYNHPDESILYYALSLLQVNDGFLILCGEKSQNLFNLYPTATIIKTNELGEIAWTKETSMIAPAPKLLNIAGKIGFVAMDNSNMAYFTEINPESGEIVDSTSLNLTMPLAAKVINGDKLVVLGYNYSSWTSIISLVNSGLSEENRTELAVGDDYVSSVDEHMRKTGYEYPFFIGEWDDGSNSGFFVNCLYNYTLGIKFFDYVGASTSGWIVVHQVKYAPSSLLHKDGNQFAMTRYYNGKNFINASLDVDVNNIQNFNDSTQNPWDELPTKAKICSKKIMFGENEFLVFVSATNTNSIVVSQYKMDDTDYYHKYYLDFSDQVEVIDIIQDETDEGLLVLARTYVTGKYIRPMLIKIPKTHLRTE